MSASARERTRANDFGKKQHPEFARVAEPEIVLIGAQLLGGSGAAGHMQKVDLIPFPDKLHPEGAPPVTDTVGGAEGRIAKRRPSKDG